MKHTEILELTDKELQERLDNEKDYLARLRLNHAISPLDNPNKIVESRRNVARLMTELNRRSKTTGTGTESGTVESGTVESGSESGKS
jgi:large subunit ribosomal protein L29